LNFAKFLLKNNAKFDYTDSNTYKIITQIYKPSIYEFLINKYFDLSRSDNNGRTLLHWAVIENNELLLNYLLNIKSININLRDKFGNTPLYYAVKFRRENIIERLINAGADPNIRGQNNLSPYDLSQRINLNIGMIYLIKYRYYNNRIDKNINIKFLYDKAVVSKKLASVHEAITLLNALNIQNSKILFQDKFIVSKKNGKIFRYKINVKFTINYPNNLYLKISKTKN